MSEQHGGTTALAEAPQHRDLSKLTVEQVVHGNIKSAEDLAERVRALTSRVFLLSPMALGGQIANGYQVQPLVVPIDTSFDPDTGRGADVYHQASIHKRRKDASGNWEPVEVSLNSYGLLKILNNFGVNVHPTRWIQDGTAEKYLFICETDGDVEDFTGTRRMLPTGIGSLDARDGSADIGEWTPEEWKARVAAADAKFKADVQAKRAKEGDRWKREYQPEPINGWSAERVMAVRKYGRQLAKTKSLNGLARKLGVRQSYTIKELQAKPFVILRSVFVPDMSDPAVRLAVTQSKLGAVAALYPGRVQPAAEPVAEATTHGPGEVGQTLTGEVVEEKAPEPAERMQTAAPPEGAEEVSFDEPQPSLLDKGDVYVVTKLTKREGQYFAETDRGVVLYTDSVDVAKALDKARKDKAPREVPTERIVVAGQPYRAVLEVLPAKL